MSIGQLRAESRRLTPLMLDGEPPTVEAMAGKRYKLSRTLYVASRSQPTEETLGSSPSCPPSRRVNC